MSQSNKKGNVLFIIIIFMIIIISGLVTYFAIINHNKETSNVFKNSEFAKVDYADIVDVFKKYPVNPIKFDEKKFEISGLKDKNIEKKINEKLIKLKNDNEDVYNWCNVGFNNSNVFSIECNLGSVTVDLNTGEDINLEDIFNNNTDILPIISTALYNNACNYRYDCYSQEREEDYQNQIDNYIVQGLKDIKNGNYSLFINSNYININLVDSWDSIVISFADYQNEITIYNRYLNDNNIYESDIQEYCDVHICYTKNDNDDSDNRNIIYTGGYYLDGSTYIHFYIHNETNCSFLSCNIHVEKETIDMKNTGEKILKEIIKNNKLDDNNKNYRFIFISASIYQKSFDYNLIHYEATIYESDLNNFQKTMLGGSNLDYISTNSINRIDMVLKDNTFKYLKSNPNEIFDNFENDLSSYIKANIKDENDYESPFYGMFYGRMEPLKISDEIIYKIIKESGYLIDYDNKKLYMTYDYSNIELPWDIFTLKTI